MGRAYGFIRDRVAVIDHEGILRYRQSVFLGSDSPVIEVIEASLAALPRAAPEPAPTAVENTQSPTAEFALGDNYPNPFNNGTAIRFTLPRAAAVWLAVYDSRGSLVRQLLEGHLKAGAYAAVWDGRTRTGHEAGSGVYFYRLTTARGARTGKMMLVR